MSHGVDPWLFFVPVFRAQWLPAHPSLLSEESVCILPCFACAVGGGGNSCDFAEGFGEVAA